MDELIESILKFRKERNWKQFHTPKNLAISMLLEAGEVLELFQWTKDHKLPKERLPELKEELADVYYWLLLLSHEFKIDLNKEFKAKMVKNAKKYPVSKAKGTSKKYTKL